MAGVVAHTPTPPTNARLHLSFVSESHAKQREPFHTLRTRMARHALSVMGGARLFACHFDL